MRSILGCKLFSFFNLVWLSLIKKGKKRKEERERERGEKEKERKREKKEGKGRKGRCVEVSSCLV